MGNHSTLSDEDIALKVARTIIPIEDGSGEKKVGLEEDLNLEKVAAPCLEMHPDCHLEQVYRFHPLAVHRVVFLNSNPSRTTVFCG